MIKLVCDAIKNKNVIEFIYNNEIRKVEPFCHGKTGNIENALRGYQISGYSSTGKLGWKMFDLSKAHNIKILKEKFDGERPDYKRDDKNMVRIFCQI